MERDLRSPARFGQPPAGKLALFLAGTWLATSDAKDHEGLMIEKNESITLAPGRPFKKIFMLVETDPWTGSSRAR